ncbi:MAG: glutamate--tRNA ligase [Candidatus Hydrogenedentes bacterium CG1_02_42_14]|nr:MAG: glutamate--tRNA ligase [Candidatus Hydrogenedentes bacterium CG1_02_42_14]
MIVTRFAPSPTGALHVGGARTALYAWAFARHNNGKFILRIEDTDRERSDMSHADEIVDALQWMGLNWDEGPIFQSDRKEIYREHAEKLVELGAAYRCFCSQERLEEMRKEQTGKGVPEGYDRRCRNLSIEEVELELSKKTPHVIRFKMPLDGETIFRDELRGTIAYPNTQQDDFILLKSDGFPTYHLANVIDDHLMNVTHVMRGEEWIPSTPKHVRLYESFGWEPPAFVHLPVILAPDGKKLSKRHGATSVQEYRERGFLPTALLNYLTLLGWSPGDDREIFSRDELAELFSLERVNKRSAVFDETKLRWLNGKYLMELSWDRFEPLIMPYVEKFGLKDEQLKDWGVTLDKNEWIKKTLELGKERAETVIDVIEKLRFFYEEEIEFDEESVKKHFKGDDLQGRIEVGREAIQAANPWSIEELEKEIRGRADVKGFKHPKVFHPMRVAVTGRQHAPGLFTTIFLIGRNRALKRVEKALGIIANTIDR